MRLVLTVRANLIPSPPTFNSDYGYISWEAYANVSYYTRVLPPVPDNCPTPMGTKGKQQLPDPQLLAERFLLRQKFEADPRGTNLMFAFFAQHFTHQFFKTSGKMGRGFTKALGHGVDLGHLYGDNLQRQHQLRLFRDGKLKFQVVDGEVYPPTVTDASVHMVYPPDIPKEKQLAMGQEVFGLLPGLCMYTTLWLREHNRVCDILKREHPTWSDEQLFQTARLILIGETIKIVIEDYVQHLSGYFLSLKFDPELLFGTQFQYRNRIAVEFNQLYHWHGLMPDSFIIQGQEYSYEQFLYNTSMLMDYGVEALVESFSKQIAGRIGGGQTINANVLKVAVGVIKESRQLRLQPFNEYRKRFGMKPYESFQELTAPGPARGQDAWEAAGAGAEKSSLERCWKAGVPAGARLGQAAGVGPGRRCRAVSLPTAPEEINGATLLLRNRLGRGVSEPVSRGGLSYAALRPSPPHSPVLRCSDADNSALTSNNMYFCHIKSIHT
ncbi:prostaglandin G/H synthase 1 isoform 4-T5 [Theristicus caerulescens]